ncbi:hypothetical protein M1C57_23780 (plasmid) [Rhodococcus pyridinivorans]|nr:hypothetical protein [Rhodococcus pyridinivorans]UPW06917.1 hypothetical protein M1C57_23780 [Rhodococcus pyridinivorans]
MSQGSGLEFGDDLLDDRVVAVVPIGGDRWQGAVGDERMVSVGGEQLALLAAVTGRRLQAPDPPHDEPARDVLGPLRR